jgi:hypothetical protein
MLLLLEIWDISSQNKMKKFEFYSYMILGFHGSDYEECRLLR